jgi:hypothetical protein
MVKRTKRTKGQNIAQKTKDWVTTKNREWAQYVPQGWAVAAPLVAPVVLILLL